MEGRRRVLYCRPDLPAADFAPAASPPTSRVREGRSETPESLESWIDRSEDDFAAMQAAASLDRQVHGIVCFHAHQCAEKLLKACLIARSIRPARTHDLNELLDACVTAGFNLGRLRPACETLVRLWPKSRYPERGKPTRSDAAAAVEAATAVRDAILPLLPRVR
jgi:HEPN domain-containing protein